VRLADEYDAAQERGEVATRQHNPGSRGHVPEQNMPPATTAELGLTRKDIYEARQIREPAMGIVIPAKLLKFPVYFPHRADPGCCCLQRQEDLMNVRYTLVYQTKPKVTLEHRVYVVRRYDVRRRKPGEAAVIMDLPKPQQRIRMAGKPRILRDLS